MNIENQFKETFRQEASELLVDIEDAILDIEQNPDDKESINRLFRSMHTIKGSGAMFGFDNVADFVHHIETLLDKVRGGSISITGELIDLIFMSKDQIKSMINDSGDECSFDPSVCNMITTKLKSFLPNLKPDSEEISINSQNKDKEEPAKEHQTETIYRIRFQPNPEIMTSGMDPATILNELRDLGECGITAHTRDISELKKLEPEQCFFSWDIILKTNRDINDIKDVFMFVEEESIISIKSLADTVLSDTEQEPPLLGEILVDRGDITSDNINNALKNQKKIGELLVESGTISLEDIESALSEQKILNKKKKPVNQDNIRIASEKLDKLINLVGELVINQSTLIQEEENSKESGFSAPVKRMEQLIRELRDITLNMRMMPVENLFGRFRRLVRDLSSELNKEVELITEGGETELDKSIIERLHDPLVHLIRNSIDHGLCSPDKRERNGKSRKGTIRLSASHQGARVNITISDDGMGINKESVKAKALEKGLIPKDANLTETEIFDLIFAPGFSTAAEVTGVSGRGVGMDVVKREISALGGTIQISSTAGQGTSAHLSMPLTLAIIEGLLIKADQRSFILPVSQIETCMESKNIQMDKTKDQNMIWFKGDLIPFVRLRDVFKIPGTIPSVEHIATFHTGHYRIGIVADEIIGNVQTVIKPLDRLYRHAKGISGATIMGDGTVALIIDLPELILCAKTDKKQVR